MASWLPFGGRSPPSWLPSCSRRRAADRDDARLPESIGERLAQQLPGLAAVIVRSDGLPRVYVSGERRIGKGDLITAADRMHLGSLTKAITATLIGALAEKRLMTFETTIGQTFPELSAKIQPAYRGRPAPAADSIGSEMSTPTHAAVVPIRPARLL